MKFIEDARLLQLTNTLNGANFGDRVVYGRIECYTCKSVKAEKQVSKEIEKQLVADTHHPQTAMISTPTAAPTIIISAPTPTNMVNGSQPRTTSTSNLAVTVTHGHTLSKQSPMAVASSPLGPLTASTTRKLLINLIHTMNASFADYDFSNLRADQFEHETSRFRAQDVINTLVLTAMDVLHPGFRDNCWKILDEVIDLDKCEIYKYCPDLDSDLGIHKLWAINYFFLNKKQKKTGVLLMSRRVKDPCESRSSISRRGWCGCV